MNEGLQIRIPGRMMFSRIALTMAMVLSTLLTYNLWAGDRLFPKASLWAANPGRTLEAVLFFTALACLLGSMFFRWQRVLVGCGLAMLLYLASCDVNRVQPWFFVYASMLLVFVFFNGRVDDPSHYTSLFVALQLMYVAVYFAVALNLARDGGLAERARHLATPLGAFLSERQFNGLLRLVPVVPWLVFLTAAGLVITPVRFLAISVAAGFHVVLLWFQFPHDPAGWAAWLKNVTFLLLLPLLFSGKTRERHFDATTLFFSPMFYFALGAFYVLPIVKELSHGPRAIPRMPWTSVDKPAAIVVSDPGTLPAHLRAYCVSVGDTTLLNYEAWCMRELHGTVYPSDRVAYSILTEFRHWGVVARIGPGE